MKNVMYSFRSVVITAAGWAWLMIAVSATHQHEKRILCGVLGCPNPTTQTVIASVTARPTSSTAADKNGKRDLCAVLGCPAVVTQTITTTIVPEPTLPPSPPTNLTAYTCGTEAYGILGGGIATYDLRKGGQFSSYESVGNLPLQPLVNGIGFNPLDNFVYGAKGKNVIRIGKGGSAEVVGSIPEGAQLGDVDVDGRYYYSTDGSSWGIVDLDPRSSNYATIIDQGTSDISMFKEAQSPADWAATPAMPGYLYSVVAGADNMPEVVRWSIKTHEWEIVYKGYNDPRLMSYEIGSIVATSDGIIYAIGLNSVDILRFPLSDLKAASFSASLEGSPIQDSARCVLPKDQK